MDKNLTATTQEYCKQYWTSPGGNTPKKQQPYGYLPPITKTIEVKWTRDARHCRRSKDALISNIFLWPPSHRRENAGRPARKYILQLCADTAYSLEDLPGAMDDRDWWGERVREIRASSGTWWCLSKFLNCHTIPTLVCTEIKREIRINFYNFIRNGRVPLQQKCFGKVLYLGEA